MNKSRTFSSVFVLLWLGGVVNTLEAKDNEELLDFVLLQNAAARKRIQSISYSFRYEFDRNDPVKKDPDGKPRRKSGPTHGEGWAEVLEKGACRWSSRQELKKWTGFDGSEQTRSDVAVVNGDYIAFWPTRTVNAYQFDRLSPRSMSGRVAETLQIHSALDPLECGLGPRGTSIRNYYLESRDENLWTVEEKTLSDSSTVFDIKRFEVPNPASHDRPEYAFVIDPEKGFLVTQSTSYGTDGSIEEQQNITVEKLRGTDIWLPTEIVGRTRRVKSIGASGSYELKVSRKTVITDVKVNEPVEDSRFTVSALGLKEGTNLIRERTNGEIIGLRFLNGAFVPVP